MCFSEHRPGGHIGNQGFTLLEVMIAVILIAIALVTLIGSQVQSVAIATGSRFDTVASLLAQWKVTELRLQAFDQLNSSSGTFEDKYPDFSWQTEVRLLEESETGIAGSQGLLKLVEVTVVDHRDRARTLSVRTIVGKSSGGTE